MDLEQRAPVDTAMRVVASEALQPVDLSQDEIIRASYRGTCISCDRPRWPHDLAPRARISRNASER